MGIAIDYKKTDSVLWGTFELPGTEGGKVTCDGTRGKYGLPVFVLSAELKQKYEPVFNEIVKRLQARLESHSIYRGKALKIDFEQQQIEFLDVENFDSSKLVYPKITEKLLYDNLHVPLRHLNLCKQTGVPTKRGLLLAGPYGTGKTVQAFYAGQVAVQNGWGFVFLNDVRQLAMAIQFVKQYGRTLIYSEDIDQAVSGDRNADMQQILNHMDGIDTKEQDVMFLFTTNHLEKIEKALLRPGRIDVAIQIGAPDEEAVARLVHVYAGAKLDKSFKGDGVGRILAGQIPAVIREAVERSKLSAIGRAKTSEFLLTDEDIETGAHSVMQQVDLTNVDKAPSKHVAVQFFEALAATDAVERTADTVKRMAEALPSASAFETIRAMKENGLVAKK